MTCLVSFLSEHLLPNYLVAKEMEGRYEQHVFITTRRMGDEGMTARLCNALKINKKEVRLVVVSEEDLPDARRKLDGCGFSRDDRYLVNLTGGTKIMSLAAITKDLGKGVNPYIFIKQGLPPHSFNDARLASIKRRMKILGIKELIGAAELRQKQLPLT